MFSGLKLPTFVQHMLVYILYIIFRRHRFLGSLRFKGILNQLSGYLTFQKNAPTNFQGVGIITYEPQVAGDIVSASMISWRLTLGSRVSYLIE